MLGVVLVVLHSQRGWHHADWSYQRFLAPPDSRNAAKGFTAAVASNFRARVASPEKHCKPPPYTAIPTHRIELFGG
jgi:hypothetical protein